ncbi:transposase [Streptomyces zaomyceticus]
MRVHIRFGGPIVVVWDNPNTHLAAELKRYEAEHDRLTIIRLPPYAPDLNPVEAVWELVRSDGQHRLRHTRRPRPQTPPRVSQNPTPAPLIDGCLTATNLTFAPPTPP